MGTVFRNALLVQLDPPMVENGDLRQAGGFITDVGVACRSVTGSGTEVKAETGDEVIDLGGIGVLMPGLVNGHTHLYSSLAVGIPMVSSCVPKKFLEILKFIWWRLDQAHNLESVKYSGLTGAINAVRCGVTSLIDHHASPGCIEGSLDSLELGISQVGCRAVLCYEVTDRNGGASEGARGIRENERYIIACRKQGEGGHNRFGAMVGGHASFTMSDASLASCVDLARQYGVGLHIHVAEDPVDELASRREYKAGIFQRFRKFGFIDNTDGIVPGSIFGHCTHLAEEEIKLVNQQMDCGLVNRFMIAHAARSNMNNGVGYTPVVRFNDGVVMLGTDGIDNNMLKETQAAYFKSQDADRDLSLDMDISRPLQMLGNAARCAANAMIGSNIRLGALEVGSAADLVVMDYLPATIMDTNNLAGHLVFGWGSEYVKDVMIGGEWVLRDRKFVNLDIAEVCAKTREVADLLHKRMAEIAV